MQAMAYRVFVVSLAIHVRCCLIRSVCLKNKIMPKSDQIFPALLASLNKHDYDYADGDGIDFEPYSEFLSAEETTSWFRAWTGNDAADGSCFRVFGQDGTGGYAAFWITQPDKNILEQPIVFLGSEGQKGVVALDFDSYLWLLASGVGPYEAVTNSMADGSVHDPFLTFARDNSSVAQMGARMVVEQARSKYPDFTALIGALCR
jgi:hypothetical protein